MDIDKIVRDEIQSHLPDIDISKFFAPCQDALKGDYNIICFPMAKQMRSSPNAIAESIAVRIRESQLLEKIESVGGYVNIFVSPIKLAKMVMDTFDEGKLFSLTQVGKNKKCFIDFCSVNLAKYMHIGHLAGTAIGACVARILEAVGYSVVRINYLGDSGTSFGKVIAAYKLWGKAEDVHSRGVDYLQELYVAFNQEEEKDPKFVELAKKVFIDLENGDKELLDLHKLFCDVSIAECKRLLDMMNVSFDDWRGESFYTGKTLAEGRRLLDDSGMLVQSEGAKIIDLTDCDKGIALIEKSDGASTYLSRDISAVMDRYDRYAFDKGFYVTALQQNGHFAQLFEICKRLGLSFADNLRHISYGMFSLPSGKIGSRFGKQAILSDIFSQAINKARDILLERNYPDDLVENNAKSVGISAVMFSVLKSERTKDSVFDVEKAISFDGETAPYIQYTFARCNSVLNRAKEVSGIDVGVESIASPEAIELIKLMANYERVIFDSLRDCEPCFVSRYVLCICKAYNVFYTKQRIITADGVDKYRLHLTLAVSEALKKCMGLLGIDVIEVM